MKKKHIYLFVLLSLVAMFLSNMKTTIEVHAEPERYAGEQMLLNDEMAEVTASYEINHQTVRWTIQYSKKDAAEQQQLKIAVSPLPGLSAISGLSQLSTTGDWFILSDFDDATTGEITFETSLNEDKADEDYGLSISLQRDLKVSEDDNIVLHENVLDASSAATQQVLIDANHLAFVKNEDATANNSTESTETTETETNTEMSNTDPDTYDINTSTDDVTKQEAIQSNQSITPRVETSGGQGSLVISDKIFNDPANMTVSIQGTETYLITRKDSSTERKNYDSNEDNLNYVYMNYLEGSGKVNIEFGTGKDKTYLSNVVVEVNYPAVGYIINQSGKLIPIGATLTIQNIQRSPSPTTWSGYPFAQPSIDLATNLYSGMVLNGISAANFSFVFTDPSGTAVNFSNLTNPFMTFSSLNGYGTPDDDGFAHQSEFVRATDNREGVVTADTVIKKGTVSTPSGQNFDLEFKNVYHGTSNNFTDYLGGETYNNSSVSFALIGEKNTFQIGTGGGEGHRGWFTFASAAITPVKQEAPAKTVQPLKQYQADDDWYNPSGEASGWAQRFYNDLDRYGVDDTPQNQWDLFEQYRVAGHDADKPEELAAGVPQKADRFVEKGKEYFYYINQPTINLVSEGLVMPTGYQITDTPPDGIEFVAAELFDLTGESLSTLVSSTEGKILTFDLNESQVAIINAQSKDPNYYGGDFSIRIRFRVGDDATSNPINNTASSTFSYPNGVSYDQNSNVVQIKVKTIAGRIEIKKTDSFGDDQPVEGTEFSLYKFDGSSDDNKGDLFGRSKQTIVGKNLVFEDLPIGRYVLSETGTVGKFVSEGDFYFEITEAGDTVWQDESGDPLAIQPEDVLTITNTKGYDLTLLKTDEVGNKLQGARFTLSGEDLTDTIEVTSTDSGSISFTDGILQAGKTYILTEIEAPSGYFISAEGPWTISISEDGRQAEIKTKDGVSTDLVVTIDDIDPDAYYPITGPSGFSIENYPKIPLPATGGPGIWPYFLVGGFIISGVFVRRRTVFAKGGRH